LCCNGKKKYIFCYLTPPEARGIFAVSEPALERVLDGANAAIAALAGSVWTKKGAKQ